MRPEIPDINLLPKYERQSSMFMIIFIGGFVIWLLLFSLLLFHYFNTKGSLGSTQAQINQLTETKNRLEQQVASEQSTNADTLAGAVQYVEDVTFPTSSLIDNLMTLLPEHAYLSEYEYNEGAIKIQSQFETMDVAADYVAKLVASDYTNDVKVDEIEAFVIDENEEINFTTVPRYDVTQTFEANVAKLRGEDDGDE